MVQDASTERSRGTILGVGLDRISCSEASTRVCSWAALCSSRTVLAANVHMTMEAFDDSSFRKVLNEADLVVPDGQPLVWALKARGYSDASHVRGHDLILAICRTAEERGLRIGMYGSTDEVLDAAARNLRERFPRLDIAYSFAPPFRALDAREDREVVEAINASGAQVLFVAIGCPKQEKWMAAHVQSVRAVLIGVGAAIDMIGGQQPVAPLWMQSSGLEWAFRLSSDPSRLWRRYAKHNLRFVALVGVETATVALRTGLSRLSRVNG